ncbi:MAG TPA: hypothetical protein VJI12_01635 [archaeon]|nr:hypothetical protein [archaeon]
MEARVIVATAVLVLAVLFFVGGGISENCIDIGGCRQCWKTTQVVVNDAVLCSGNSSCLAQPRDQQNNAIVDAVFCACNGARANGYSDPSVNNKIEDIVSAFTNFNMTATQICEQPAFLVKVYYA